MKSFQFALRPGAGTSVTMKLPYTIDTDGWLDPHLSQEWLLTNGLGSFASSTILSCNTRRYHGLLCAAVNPPVGRVMTINRIAETLTFEGDDPGQVELSLNQFGSYLHPRGDRVPAEPSRSTRSARWDLQAVGDTTCWSNKCYWLVPGENRAALRYTVDRVRCKAVFTGTRAVRQPAGFPFSKAFDRGRTSLATSIRRTRRA